MIKELTVHEAKSILSEFKSKLHDYDIDRLDSILLSMKPDFLNKVECALDTLIYKTVPVSSFNYIDRNDMGEISDGYHTFNELYHQRAVLFATIVNSHKNISWKSLKHNDGKYCFDKNGDWFVVGIMTPKGQYTYHYETSKYWDLFECKELEVSKPFDGHDEKDVTRLLSLLD